MLSLSALVTIISWLLFKKNFVDLINLWILSVFIIRYQLQLNITYTGIYLFVIGLFADIFWYYFLHF